MIIDIAVSVQQIIITIIIVVFIIIVDSEPEKAGTCWV